MAIEILMQRRSIPSRQLGEPGPNPTQIDTLLAAAIRVPDHGKLTPWRLLLIRGTARAHLGETIATIHARKNPDLSSALLAKDRERFNFAPVIIAVIARVETKHPKIPEQEQILSAGCVAYNLLLGAQLLGFGAQWLTGWAAYDNDVAALLELNEHERIIGFIHIGTVQENVPERLRPALEDVVSEWKEKRQ